MSELLSNHDFKFQKKYGQNFLTDVKIPRRISMECTDYMFESDAVPEKKAPYLVLEIGPGAGILTKELSDRFCKVAAVEIDENLRGVLAESLAGRDNTEVYFGDVMDVDLQEFVNSRNTDGNGNKLQTCVCANLPYYITTPIIMKLLEEYGNFRFITVMVQKEVATRLCAKPDSAEYGAITAAINLYGNVKRLFTVPSGCFFPRPKVDSAVIRIETFKTPLYTKEEIAGASRLIKAAFGMRRKTLVNSLASVYPELTKQQLTDKLVEIGFSETVRGEKLTADDFVRLSKALA